MLMEMWGSMLRLLLATWFSTVTTTTLKYVCAEGGSISLCSCDNKCAEFPIFPFVMFLMTRLCCPLFARPKARYHCWSIYLGMGRRSLAATLLVWKRYTYKVGLSFHSYRSHPVTFTMYCFFQRLWPILLEARLSLIWISSPLKHRSGGSVLICVCPHIVLSLP